MPFAKSAKATPASLCALAAALGRTMKKSSADQKLILSLPEYERIYRVIFSVLNGNTSQHTACIFFAVAGSLILNKHYQIPARPVAGGFLLCVDEAPSIVGFGRIENGTIAFDAESFHMWVQTESHIVDFMAPIFNEALQSKGHNKVVPRKMFQRRIATESESADALVTAGDYFSLPDPELSDSFVEDFKSRDLNMDLLSACDKWFRKYPKKLADISLMDQSGSQTRVHLKAPAITGVW